MDVELGMVSQIVVMNKADAHTMALHAFRNVQPDPEMEVQMTNVALVINVLVESVTQGHVLVWTSVGAGRNKHLRMYAKIVVHLMYGIQVGNVTESLAVVMIMKQPATQLVHLMVGTFVAVGTKSSKRTK